LTAEHAENEVEIAEKIETTSSFTRAKFDFIGALGGSYSAR
jgi:hypothetical protein